MTRVQLIIGFLLTLALTIAAGAIHGRLSGRWGGSEEAMQAAQSISSLPDQFGSWRLDQNAPFGESELGMLKPFGYINRTYLHLESGQKVSVFVLLGPVGETAVHNPEICYSSRASTIIGAKEQTSLRVDGPRTDQFWAMTFRSNDLEGGLMRVYYAWSDGTRWEAPEGDFGRYKYAGLPYLYKIQLAAEMPANADPKKDDACRDFLEDFLPVLAST